VTMQEIKRAAEKIAGVKRLVVTTGAGMSRESGIPTFREAPNALWARYNPEELATEEGFRKDPPLVWKWYTERRNQIGRKSPHAGHYAVAGMEPLFDSFTLITQNIDNLHRKAGSKNLIELHGNIFRFKCFDNHHPVEILPQSKEIPPLCECGSYIRPDVVWFGEMLDEDDLNRSFSALSGCEVILVVGTSGLVYPAAGFPGVAKSYGAFVVEINPEETPITNSADVVIRAGAAEALPQLLNRIRCLRET
jgi:NAD-dependent deacetylase